MGNSSSTTTSSLGRLRRALRHSGVGGGGGGGLGAQRLRVRGGQGNASAVVGAASFAFGTRAKLRRTRRPGRWRRNQQPPNDAPSSPSHPLPFRFPRRPRSNPDRYIARPSKLGQSVINSDLAVLSGDASICRGGRRRSVVSAAISVPTPSKRKLPAEAKSRSERTKYDTCGKCLWTPMDEVMAAANITTLTPCSQCRSLPFKGKKQKEKRHPHAARQRPDERRQGHPISRTNRSREIETEN
ncbi:hypothetical protein ACHAWF_002013 [Thalassiosira exigua]